jgi:hypothetical protein
MFARHVSAFNQITRRHIPNDGKLQVFYVSQVREKNSCTVGQYMRFRLFKDFRSTCGSGKVL